MSKVYIAGPMRNIPFFNFPAFDTAAALGRSLGWEVISPAEIDRANGIDEHALPADHPFTPAELREMILRDVDVIARQLKAENGDAIALLPGWGKSSGARPELMLALWAKLQILSAVDFKPVAVVFEADADGFSCRI